MPNTSLLINALPARCRVPASSASSSPDVGRKGLTCRRRPRREMMKADGHTTRSLAEEGDEGHSRKQHRAATAGRALRSYGAEPRAGRPGCSRRREAGAAHVR